MMTMTKKTEQQTDAKTMEMLYAISLSLTRLEGKLDVIVAQSKGGAC